MITSSNSTWNTQLAAQEKTALWAISISSLSLLEICTFVASARSVTLPGGATNRPFLFATDGSSQTIDELSGASSVGQYQVECIDPDGKLKGLLSPSTTPSAIGQTAQLLLGFPTMNFTDFVPVATSQVTKVGWSSNGRVVFYLDDVQRSLVQYIFLQGGPAPWLPGTPPALPPVGPSSATNGQPIQDANPYYLQGNPMEIFLVVAQNFLGIGQANPSNPSTWQIYVPGQDSTLINPNAYLDVPGILLLRNHQFNGDWMEFTLKAQQTAKGWLEQQILKPLGLYTVVLSTGVMTLKSMKTPPTTSPVTWSGRSTIQESAGLETLEIINQLQARFDQDDFQASSAAPSYLTNVEYQDAGSISQFKVEHLQQMELQGLRTRFGAFARAYLLADRIFRRHAHGTPTYQVDVQLRNLQPELGVDFVTFSHPTLPDLKNNGTYGLTSVACEVMERRPRYSTGKLSYKLLDTRFVQPSTAYQIAPSGTPVWTSSTSTQKSTYLYISNDAGLMSDGAAGNTIF